MPLARGHAPGVSVSQPIGLSSPAGADRRRRRTLSPRSLILCLFLLLAGASGCGLYSGVKDLTENANDILRHIDDLTREIDSKIATGELDRDVGSLLDERLQKLREELAIAVEDQGGFLFDEANGTLDQTLGSVSGILDQIEEEILMGAVPVVLNELSSQLTFQTTHISGQLEDLITLSFGNAFVLVDKTVNGIVIILSILLLAIGVIVMAVLLLRRRQALGRAGMAGLVLGGVYVLFFLSVLVVPPVRGFVISGLDLGVDVERQALRPQITGAFPESFTVGDDDRLVIYGKHLEKVAVPRVRLFRGEEQVFEFPPATVAAVTRNRVILSGFEEALGWSPPEFEEIAPQIFPQGLSELLEGRYTMLAYARHEVQYPARAFSPGIVLEPETFAPLREVTAARPGEVTAARPGGVTAVRPGDVTAVRPGEVTAAPEEVTAAPPGEVTTAPLEETSQLHDGRRAIVGMTVADTSLARVTFSTLPRTRIKGADLHAATLVLATDIFASEDTAEEVVANVSEAFRERFNIDEGDYSLRLFDGDSLVATPQFLSLAYPPPPPPRPDIRPLSVTWADGLEPAKGEQASIKVRVGIAYPQEVKSGFRVALTSSPAVDIDDLIVTRQQVQAAQATGFLDLTTRPFLLPREGVHQITVIADSRSNVGEEAEGNNTLAEPLRVRSVKYDLTVQLIDFQSEVSKDGGEDEYRIDIAADVSGHPRWKVDFDKNGEPGRVYAIGQERTFPGLVAGSSVHLSTSGYEEDYGNWFDEHDDMGSDWQQFEVPAETAARSEFPKQLHTDKYYVHVRLVLERRLE